MGFATQLLLGREPPDRWVWWVVRPERECERQPSVWATPVSCSISCTHKLSCSAGVSGDSQVWVVIGTSSGWCTNFGSILVEQLGSEGICVW